MLCPGNDPAVFETVITPPGNADKLIDHQVDKYCKSRVDEPDTDFPGKSGDVLVRGHRLFNATPNTGSP